MPFNHADDADDAAAPRRFQYAKWEAETRATPWKCAFRVQSKVHWQENNSSGGVPNVLRP